MSCIAFPFRAGNRPHYAIVLALATALAIVAATTIASVRPRNGGILRVQIRERVATIDPRQWPQDSTQAAANERLDSLVFDRLVKIGEYGTPQAALAISWQHDAQSKRWQFHLRQNVKFSDGAPFTPEAAALALQQLLGNDFDVRATPDSVVIQADRSMADLATTLATGRYFIFHATIGGGVSGTGPFLISSWTSDSAPKIILAENESCWAGRPFVDKIELTMGVDFEQQANAIAFGQADVVELPASQVRRATQRGVRTASSDPVELFALQFDATRPAVQDQRVRQAISQAIDRSSIAEVILQKQGKAAGSLLPNWISGYAHLFPVVTDLPRAKELLAATGREVSRPAPLVLVYDSGDAEARAIAERVAVNLREIGFVTQISGQGGSERNVIADARLARYRLTAPDAEVALADLFNALGESPAALETPEQAYAAERAPIDAFRIIPLVHVTESYGLSPQVRDWMPPRWGGWRLEDVWLGPPQAAAGATP
jgi:ABC-type transport system substrate-binding protein